MVWRDPLSRLDLTAAALLRSSLLLRSSSTVHWRGQTNIATNKHPGMTIRLTLCQRDAIIGSSVGTQKLKISVLRRDEYICNTQHTVQEEASPGFMA